MSISELHQLESSLCRRIAFRTLGLRRQVLALVLMERDGTQTLAGGCSSNCATSGSGDGGVCGLGGGCGVAVGEVVAEEMPERCATVFT